MSGTRRAVRLFLGMVAGNAVGGGLSLLVQLAASREPSVYPSLLGIPLIIGGVAMAVWGPLRLGLLATVVYSFLCTLMGLVGACVIFQEGMICLVLAFPLLYGGVLTGALILRGLAQLGDDRLRISVLPLGILLTLGEPWLRGPATGVVTDELRIRATPAQVWPHVLAFPTITAAPDYWLFRLGLPYPVATTNEGNRVGADRACQFSGGAVFEETIVEFEPQRRLTFDIVRSPPDPELLGHLDAQRGQFELQDNGDGTTTLTGRTWYSLHVRPAWYFEWWTQDIFRAVHLRVMQHVKQLSETPP